MEAWTPSWSGDVEMEVLLRKSVRLAMDTGQWEMEQGVEKTQMVETMMEYGRLGMLDGWQRRRNRGIVSGD